MRRIVPAFVVTLALVSCGGGIEREFERYYDPSGFFSAELPSDNAVQVLPAEAGGDETAGPQLLSGVQSVPAQPSPAQGVGGFGIDTTAPTDQTAYYVFAFTSSLLTSEEDLAEIYTGQPSVDVRVQEPVQIGREAGLLIVADNETDEGARFSVASGFLLDGDVGYWIAAAFPEGRWDGERDDFLKVLSSFRTEVPPAVTSIPVGGS